MKLLDRVLEEYFLIVEQLIEKKPVVKDRIVIECETFRILLERFPFLSFREKTRIYKDLNLIYHDKNNYTLPYHDKELKKTVSEYGGTGWTCGAARLDTARRRDLTAKAA